MQIFFYFNLIFKNATHIVLYYYMYTYLALIAWRFNHLLFIDISFSEGICIIW